MGFAIISLYTRDNNLPGMTEHYFKVDSGASVTTFQREALYRTGYDFNWVLANGRALTGDECPTVASGQQVPDCYEITIPEVNIHGNVGYNWRFLVTLNAKYNFRNLFGTDSMNFFHWTFDYSEKNNQCMFFVLSEKRRLLFNQKEQSIHSIDDMTKKGKQLLKGG
jgi:hypothetical protein